MTTRSQERRSRMMVNRPMQNRLIRNIALLPTIALAIVTAVLVFFGRQLVQEALVLGADLPSMVPLLLSVMGFVVVAAATIAFNAIKLSNRIAGPSHRMIQALRRIRNGEMGFRVHTRERDHLKEVSDELNLVLQWLETERPSAAEGGSPPQRERQVVETGQPATAEPI